MTPAGTADPQAASDALAALHSAGSHPVLQSFPQGALILFDPDLRYLGAGGHGLADVGLSREMLEGNTIFEVFPPEVVAVIEPLYRRALAGSESAIDVPYEGRIYLQRLGPVRAADGAIVAGMGFTQDVTAARRYERELHESEHRFRQLAESVNVGFVLRNLDPPEVLNVSPGYAKIIGYDPMAIGGNPLAALRRVIHPEDWERVHAQYWAKVGAGLPAESEFRVLRPDGAVRWVHATSAPVVDAEGVVRRTASTGEDITDRKVGEAARLSAENLIRATELKSEFLSRASHELRTPLNAVLGFGQLLELDALTYDQQDAVQQILQGGRDLVRLVDDILDITEMHGNEMGLEIEDVGINDLLAGCVQEMTPLAIDHGVHLHYQPGAAEVLVQADPGRLSQVVKNLLSNAIKFNRPGGRVDITHQVSDTSQNLEIVVADTGRGIATHDLPRLFLPFDRINAEANHIQGIGLGLTLSRDLMTTMRGTLLATSQDGIGSIFTASIPLTTSDGDQSGSTPASGPVFDVPKTVLYIEDNAMNVGLLEQILAYRPIVTLRVAMLGRIGLEMALDDPPDLILLDLHLPDISGQEVMQRLRANPRTATTPVVILSADATADQPQRLIALGATSYQTKPVKVPRILDLIDRLQAPEMQPSAAASSSQVNPSTGPRPSAVVDAARSINDGIDTTMSTFRHEMVNLLGVVLTYCDLLASDETKSARMTWLDKQGTATKQAIDLTQELRVPVPT